MRVLHIKSDGQFGYQIQISREDTGFAWKRNPFYTQVFPWDLVKRYAEKPDGVIHISA